MSGSRFSGVNSAGKVNKVDGNLLLEVVTFKLKYMNRQVKNQQEVVILCSWSLCSIDGFCLFIVQTLI